MAYAPYNERLCSMNDHMLGAFISYHNRKDSLCFAIRKALETVQGVGPNFKLFRGGPPNPIPPCRHLNSSERSASDAVPDGRPVEGQAPLTPWFPVSRSICADRYAVVITTVRRWVLIARGTAYSDHFPVPSSGDLPHPNTKSATSLNFSRPDGRSLTLRPVGSPSRPATRMSRRLRRFRFVPASIR
jgi:hypothetical protein